MEVGQNPQTKRPFANVQKYYVIEIGQNNGKNYTTIALIDTMGNVPQNKQMCHSVTIK